MEFREPTAAWQIDPPRLATAGAAASLSVTDEEIVQFASDRFRPRAVYHNGSYYFIGFRFQG